MVQGSSGPRHQPEAQRREEQVWGCSTCATVASEETTQCQRCNSYSFRKYPVSQTRTMSGPVVEQRNFG